MKLYDELAPWWPVISPPWHYAEEAEDYRRRLEAAAGRPLREVLELGSGGGHNASHLKAHWRMTLVDLSPGMRARSEARNPECEHVTGDMRSVRLGRTFDAVFLHDAVAYMTTESDLAAALATVAAHLAPGGVALVAPDYTAETFAPGTEVESNAEGDREVRYLTWMLPPAPGETAFDVHYAFLLRDAAGTVRCVHDLHREGLFPRATWLRLFAAAGLDARLESRHDDGRDLDLFVAVRR